MGIKVWIMKGEFTERDLSPLAGMTRNKLVEKVDLLVEIQL
jgi:ribosomal protein S3